jgi:hypothetical protein
MQPVDVLGWVDRRHEPLGVEPVGKRELNQYPIYRVVRVEPGDDRLEVFLRDVGGELVMERLDADLFGVTALATDIGL